MIMSILILAFAAFLTLKWLKPPREMWRIAWANYLIFAGFSIAFSLFSSRAVSGVDALKYFRGGTERDLSGVDRFVQADFMFWISSTLQRLLPLDYMSFNLIGAMLFSYVGLLLLMRISVEPTPRLKLAWWLVTVMPGFHFWNASFGKDSLQLLAIGAFFHFNKLVFKGAAMLVLFSVRPHVAITLGLAVGLAMMFERGFSIRKIAILASSAVVVVAALDYLVARLGGTQLNLDVLLALFTDYGDEWREGSLRNSDTSSPLAIVEFLFRPYFWEVKTWVSLVIFLDSLLLSCVGAWVMIAAFPGHKLSQQWLFALLVLIMMAFTNPNLGTALRKKQLLPFATLAVAAVAMPARRRRVVGPLERAPAASVHMPRKEPNRV